VRIAQQEQVGTVERPLKGRDVDSCGRCGEVVQEEGDAADLATGPLVDLEERRGSRTAERRSSRTAAGKREAGKRGSAPVVIRRSSRRAATGSDWDGEAATMGA